MYGTASTKKMRAAKFSYLLVILSLASKIALKLVVCFNFLLCISG